MKKELYENLTNNEKIGLLHFIRGQQGLVQHWNYEGTDENPRLKTKPDHLYLSNILNIDFDEFYSSDETSKNSSEYKDQWRKYGTPLGGCVSWYIGDAICDILFVMLDINTNHVINVELMESIDDKIKLLYGEFIALTTMSELPSTPEFYYVESGVEYNNEKLYKRVVKWKLN